MPSLSKSLIAKAELFRGLDNEALGELTDGGTVRKFREGDPLLKQGDPSDHLFMVLEGEFKMTTLAGDGGQTTLRFMKPGDIIGCAAVFNHIPYPATAVAAEPGAVLVWKTKYFEELLHKYPRLSKNALSIVGGRAFEILKRLRETRSEGAEQRVARTILKLAGGAEEGAAKEIAVSRQELAELSDASLFTVSRIVSRWTREKIIVGARKKILIRNASRLNAISSASAKPG